MPDNCPSAKGSAPAPKPTKYRLACDSCQRSKIRCDQGRPACRRCAKKGIACVYSPARRAGRPRTRNNAANNNNNNDNDKSASSSKPSTAASPSGQLTPVADHCLSIPTTRWMPPSPPPSITLSTSENCSSSNTAATHSMAPPIQLLSPEDMPFSQEQHSDDYFLQGLLDFTGSHGGSPEQTTNGDYPMFPEFHIAPELLDPSFCGAPWEPQQQQIQQEQHCQDLQQHQQPEQHQENPSTTISTSTSISTDSYSYTAAISQQQQQQQQQQPHPQPTAPNPFDHALSSPKPCHCISTLLDHLSTPPPQPSSPSPSSSAALATSKALLDRCRAALACPNACLTRPSTALLICEAIDRALASFRLGGSSLWTPTLPTPCAEDALSASSSAAAAAASNRSSSGDNSNSSSSILLCDEDQAPLRCGALPIRGADRRAAVRVLLVKRMLEVQDVLERLRDALLGLLGGRGDHAAAEKGAVGGGGGGGGGGCCWALCADVVGEFAGKVAERVEAVKVQM